MSSSDSPLTSEVRDSTGILQCRHTKERCQSASLVFKDENPQFSHSEAAGIYDEDKNPYVKLKKEREIMRALWPHFRLQSLQQQCHFPLFTSSHGSLSPQTTRTHTLCDFQSSCIFILKVLFQLANYYKPDSGKLVKKIIFA